MFKKVISLALSVVFSLQTCGFAQIGQLNLAGYLGQASAPALDRFRPAHLCYFSYEPDSDNFQILLDKADEKDLSDVQVKDKADELMRYFRIGLSLPNDKFWVNLRPDAPEQIIDPALEQTDMGKIMLEADLQLKKDTSSLTSPQTREGKVYWDKLYKKAGELFGTENITIPTITRPWIVPGEIIVRQSGSSAYIYKAALKVMLEEDYLRGMKDERRGTTTDYNFPDPRMKELNKYSTQLIRELIIPQLTKEVNRAKRYAGLRQVFYSLILARWFKQGYQNSGASERQGTRAPVNGNNTLAKLIDSGSLNNLTSREPWSKDTYYQGYKKSFEQGEYNLSETVHTPTGQLIRRYVSGGISAGSALEVNDHFDVGKVNNGIPVVGYKGVFFDGNSVEITVSSGIESKKPKVLTIKKFAHVFNEISWPDIGTVYSYSLESNPELGRRIVILRNNDGSSSKEADNRIVIRYGDRVLPSDIIGFINSKLISYLNRYINRHLTLPQHKIDDYRKSDYSKHLSEPLKIIEAIKKAEIYASSALTLEEAKDRALGFKDNFLGVLKENGGYKLWKNHELSRLFVSLIKEIELSSFVEGLEGFIKVLEGGKGEFKKPYDDQKKNFQESSQLVSEWNNRWDNVSRAYDEMLAGFKKMQNELSSGARSALNSENKESKRLIIAIEYVAKKLSELTPISGIIFYASGGMTGLGTPALYYNDDHFRSEFKKINKSISEYKKPAFWSIELKQGSTFEQIKNRLLEEAGITVSSAIVTKGAAPEDIGAVDFRVMDMLIQPAGSFSGLDFSPVRLSSSALEAMDLDKGLENIKQMASSSMLPSPQRLKEYISACIFKGKIDEKADDFILSMLEVFQLQAEEGIESASQDREAVVMADTRGYVLPEKEMAMGSGYSLN